MRQPLVNTLLGIRNGWIEFVSYSRNEVTYFFSAVCEIFVPNKIKRIGKFIVPDKPSGILTSEIIHKLCIPVLTSWCLEHCTLKNTKIHGYLVLQSLLCTFRSFDVQRWSYEAKKGSVEVYHSIFSQWHVHGNKTLAKKMTQ